MLQTKLPIIHSKFILLLVVVHSYEVRLFDEFVLRGNMAVLRCPIPSTVTDYVRVTSWERIDGYMITPHSASGRLHIFDNLVSLDDIFFFIL